MPKEPNRARTPRQVPGAAARPPRPGSTSKPRVSAGSKTARSGRPGPPKGKRTGVARDFAGPGANRNRSGGRRGASQGSTSRRPSGRSSSSGEPSQPTSRYPRTTASGRPARAQRDGESRNARGPRPADGRRKSGTAERRPTSGGERTRTPGGRGSSRPGRSDERDETGRRDGQRSPLPVASRRPSGTGERRPTSGGERTRTPVGRGSSRSGRSDPRGETGRRDSQRSPLPAAGRGWGGVARRGAFQVSRSAADAKKVEPPRWGSSKSRPAPMDEWVRVDTDNGQARSRGGNSPRSASARPTQSGAARVPRTQSLPTNVAAEIREGAVVATKRQRDYLVRRSEQSIAAYEAGRFQEALRLSKSVLNQVPTVVALIEVAGLASYRLGYWREAARYLSSYSELSGENDRNSRAHGLLSSAGSDPEGGGAVDRTSPGFGGRRTHRRSPHRGRRGARRYR